MEEKIYTRVPPQKIWQAWERAHAKYGSGTIVKGHMGLSQATNGKGVRYEVLNVVPGESFSLVWKTFFVRLIFSHCVVPMNRGSEIRYSIEIRGPFKAPIRWLLGNKIRYNISQVLKTMVKQLEKS